MEDNVENEYVVTDENGCATDPTIFGEWEYSPETNSLLASFNAFKFPSSDNIRFQCNIRVCFGRCQPVNCRGYNAFGRRRRRDVGDGSNSTDITIESGDSREVQIREELTISSNAILTFDKREDRASDGSDSKLGFFDLHISHKLNLINMQSFVFPISSSSGCSARRRYMRIDDWIDHCIGDNGFISVGRCCRGRILLADGIPTTTERNGPITASTGVPQSGIRQPRCNVRANTGLPLIK